jgi:glucose-1-phosphate cytidylyltransferase
MKVIILAGGKGTRISEETNLIPKPLVKIGKKPILWHIMKIYSTYGINDFVICLGYKGNLIKEYFQKENTDEKWNLEFVETGLETSTGGRLKKVQKYVKDETFCFTYGDTVNNLNLKDLLNFHATNKTLATVTACIPPEKYGILYLDGNKVTDFKEKPKNQKDWVNGGFFVLEPKVFDYIKDDQTVWEEEPMKTLVKKGEISAFKHTGFYQPMDNLKDKNLLNKLWDLNNAKWKVWD